MFEIALGCGGLGGGVYEEDQCIPSETRMRMRMRMRAILEAGRDGGMFA